MIAVGKTLKPEKRRKENKQLKLYRSIALAGLADYRSCDVVSIKDETAVMTGSVRSVIDFNRQIISDRTVDYLATKDEDLRFAQDAARGADRVIELGTLHAATSQRAKFRYTLLRSSALNTPANGVTFRKSRPWRLGSRTASTISSTGRERMPRHSLNKLCACGCLSLMSDRFLWACSRTSWGSLINRSAMARWRTRLRRSSRVMTGTKETIASRPTARAMRDSVCKVGSSGRPRRRQ